MAYLGDDFVGQLELEVPYGLNVGYINLYYVAAPFRRQGYGRRLHDYADRYFRAWEADRIALHVSPTNKRAVGFYRKMGYKVSAASDDPGVRLWKMTKELGGNDEG
jgi:ribosomal protein S18 acetylase RimI-like enzyme